MEKPLNRMKQSMNVSRAEVFKTLVAARRDVYAHIRKSVTDPKLATSGNTRARVLKGVGSFYDKMAVNLDAWTKDMVGRTAKNAFTAASVDVGSQKSITKFSREYAGTYFEAFSPENVSSLAAVQTQRMRASDVQALRSVFGGVMRKSAIAGMSMSAMRAEMIDGVNSLLNKGLPGWQFISSDGRKWKAGNYFNMLIRTTTAAVDREAYVDSLVADGFDLATIEGGGDPCPICASWRGLIVSITGADSSFPSLDDAKEAGVFHPNCVCDLRYLDKENGKDVIEKQKELYNNSDVPEEPTQEDWNEYSKDVAAAGARRTFTDPDATPASLKSDESLDRRLKMENVA